MTTPSNAELRDKLEKLRVIVVTDGVRRGRLANDTIDEILALFQAREQQLLTELLGELPEKVGYFVETEPELNASQQKIFGDGYNEAIDQVVSVIERYREGL